MSLSICGQAPEGFKYQAVVRDAGNLILNNQAVGMRLTVQQGSIGGTVVYTETFSTTTNAYGLVNLEIGTGTTTDDFTSIDWSNGPYFMETAVDFLGGMTWVVMGTSQLMSVPYALYAETAENTVNDLVDDADADSTNELQDWSNLPGIPVGLSDGIDNVDDADADSTNELQDWSNLPGIPAGLSDGTDDVDDADADPTNELQDWSNLPGIPPGLSDGTDDVDDADSDPTNEIQAINRSGTTVTLSNGGGTFQDSVGVYTAGSGIDITGNVISISTIDCGLEVGDIYQGGIIFYLDASGCHGLISAPTDQSTGIRWYGGSFTNTRARAEGIGAGLKNTLIIIANQGPVDGNSFAATVCNEYFGASGWYDGDWYLPSKYELNLLYLQKAVVGGFTTSSYWSSTESASNSAWIQTFSNGNQVNTGKNSVYGVRAIRAF